MRDAQDWIRHSPMSDPMARAGVIAELPSDIATLNGIIQGVLIHSDWLSAYGLDETRYRDA